MRFLLLLVPVCLLAAAPSPTPRQDSQAVVAPPQSRLSFRTYGLGIFPIDGRFTRFTGQLRYNPANPARCRMALRIDAASLVLPTALEGAMARGRDFLDVARYPQMDFRGRCRAGRIVGQLTMRGVTRFFAMTVRWRRTGLIAQGRLARADWGMTAQPLLGGRTARIILTVPLPPPAAEVDPSGR